jgi:iron complex transport system substrate-binding protein
MMGGLAGHAAADARPGGEGTPPRRVVSLLPSATELLCLAGGQRLLVGRSHECDHPAAVAGLPVLTSARIDSNALDAAAIHEQVNAHLSQTEDAGSSGQSLYHLDVDRLRTLQPDLILTQDLCSVCSIDLNSVRRVARSMDPTPAIVSLNPTSFEGVLDDLMTIGRAIGQEETARVALVALRERFFRAADYVNPFTEPEPVLFLEWTDPLFVGGHWVPQLIERAGGSHPLNPTRPMAGAGAGAGGQQAHRVAGPSVAVEPAAIAAIPFTRVIVCPCGVDMDRAERELSKLLEQPWFAGLPAFRERDPAASVAIVDGNQMFARPGPRLVDAYEWLVGWLNDRPELIPPGFPWRPMRA